MTTIDIAKVEVTTPAETARLCELERVIERGLNTFVEVGNALAEIRDAGLYRNSHATFEDYCAARWNMSRPRAYQFIEAAEIVAVLSTNVDIQPPANEAQARPLSVIEPEHRAEVWQRAVETAPEGKITARHVSEVVQEFKRETQPQPTYTQEPKAEWTATATSEEKPVYRHVSDDSYEWYTPAEYIDAARAVMGSIDLDPSSCAEANKVVGAARFYTLQDDGLVQEWRGNVYMNPPYSYPEVEQFCQKLIDAYNAGDVNQAVVLVNNSTDAAWFHGMASTASCMCFTRGRVKYWGPNSAQARQGQVFFYLGGNVKGFIKAFAGFGMLAEVVAQ